MTTLQLPPNAFYAEDGNLYHRITKMSDGGHYTQVVRPLALSLAEARDQRKDFYHPTLGLIWDGYKLASDRSFDSIINDTSIGGQKRPGDTPLPTEQVLKTDIEAEKASH